MVSFLNPAEINNCQSNEHFIGSPCPLPILPLKGTFGSTGMYEIAVQVDYVFKTQAKISWNNAEIFCAVKWDFPIIDKEVFKKLLRYTPEDSFKVHIIKEGTNFKITVTSPLMLSMQNVQHLIEAYNAENFSNNEFHLTFHRNWVNEYKGGERKKFLEDLVLQSENDVSLKIATLNAKTILAGIQIDTEGALSSTPPTSFTQKSSCSSSEVEETIANKPVVYNPIIKNIEDPEDIFKIHTDELPLSLPISGDFNISDVKLEDNILELSVVFRGDPTRQFFVFDSGAFISRNNTHKIYLWVIRENRINDSNTENEARIKIKVDEFNTNSNDIDIKIRTKGLNGEPKILFWDTLSRIHGNLFKYLEPIE
jgi:hypothetical protein